MLRRFAEPVALLLMLSVLLEVAGAYPALQPFRAYSIIGGAACLAMALPFITDPLQQLKNAFRAFPMVPALLYLIWTTILGYFSPYPVFAHTEMLRVFCGVLAFFFSGWATFRCAYTPPLTHWRGNSASRL